MLTLEQAREALRLDNTDNDDIITGLLAAIPDYIELCTGIPAEAQKTDPLADTAGKAHSCASLYASARAIYTLQTRFQKWRR